MLKEDLTKKEKDRRGKTATATAKTNLNLYQMKGGNMLNELYRNNRRTNKRT